MSERTLFRLYVFTHTASGIKYYSATSKIDKEPWTSLLGRLHRRPSRNSSIRSKLLQKTIDKHQLADCALKAIKKEWSVVAYEDLLSLEEVDAIINQAIQNDTNYRVLNTLSKAGARLRTKETPAYLNALKAQALFSHPQLQRLNMAGQPYLKLYLFTHKATGVTFLAATTQERAPWVSLHGRLARRARPVIYRTRKLQETIDKYGLYPPREPGKTRMRVLRDQWEASVVEGLTTLEEIEAFIARAISNDTDYTLLNAGKTVRCSQPAHPNVARNEQDPISAKEPWTQQADLPHTLGPHSRFGISVSLSADSNTALVGANLSSYGGKVFVYTRSGSTWTQQADLSPAIEAYGSSAISATLSADGNTILVGAINWNSQTGKVLVFTRSGSTWTQQADLPHGLGSGNYFGCSLALSADGNTALVGAYTWNAATGKVLVYTRSGSTWTQQADLAHNLGRGSYFGFSVSLSADGNTALVGVPFWNSVIGKAFVYTRNGSTWTQPTDLAHGLGSGSGFGISVSLSKDGNTALVGASDWGSATGKALIYTRSGSTWTQQADLPHTLGKGSRFGWSVSLSDDGNTALVGACGRNSQTGKAFVYIHIDGLWFLRREFTDVAGSQFGWSVSLSGDGSQALIGAPSLSSANGKVVFYQ